MAGRRTIYVIVEDRKGKRLGVAALKTLAADVVAALPRGSVSAYRGDYVAGGTRFDVLEPDATEHISTPVLKVRADVYLRERVLSDVAMRHRIVAVAGHDRKPIGGRR